MGAGLNKAVAGARAKINGKVPKGSKLFVTDNPALPKANSPRSSSNHHLNNNHNLSISGTHQAPYEVWRIKGYLGKDEWLVRLMPAKEAVHLPDPLDRKRFSFRNGKLGIHVPSERIWTYSVLHDHIIVKQGLPASGSPSERVPHIKAPTKTIEGRFRFFDLPGLGKIIITPDNQLRKPSRFEGDEINAWEKSRAHLLSQHERENRLSLS